MDFSKDKWDFGESLKMRLLYDPNDESALVLLGALHFVGVNSCEEALFFLKKAIYTFPLNGDAKFWLGLCLYLHFSEYEQAEKIFSEVLSVDPSRVDCLSQMAYLMWDKEASFEKSLSYLKKATQISPDWPMLRLELIYLLINLGRFEEAEEEIKRGALLLNQKIKVPENPVEWYYENYITGRSWTNLKERLETVENLLTKHTTDKNK